MNVYKVVLNTPTDSLIFKQETDRLDAERLSVLLNAYFSDYDGTWTTRIVCLGNSFYSDGRDTFLKLLGV